MRIHRVKVLPALTGLNPGDLYNVKPDGETVWRLWKVDNQGVPHFVTGLTSDESNRLSQLTQDVITKIINFNPDTDLGLTIGPEVPENLDDLWVDNRDLTPEPADESEVVASLRTQLNDLIERMHAVEYRFNFNLDSGGFDNKAGDDLLETETIEPGDEHDFTFNPNATPKPENEDDEKNELDVEGVQPDENYPYLAPNVKHIRIKRGNYATFSPDSLMDGELGYLKDRNLLYIGNNGTPRLISGGGGGNEGGGGNISGTHIDLQVEGSDKTYRIKVNEDGSLDIYNAVIDDNQEQVIIGENTEQLKGLMISMFYAGGTSTTLSSDNPVSHNFIEIFNTTQQDISLDGVSLYWGTRGTRWEIHQLSGTVPSKHAYLVRGARCAPEGLNTTLIEIERADSYWDDLRMPENGVKIYLAIGRSEISFANPYNTRGAAGTFANGYIDLIGAGGINEGESVDASETSSPRICAPGRIIFRVYLDDYNQRPVNTKFGDINENEVDWTYVEVGRNLHVNNAIVYKPKTTKDGPRDLYFDKNSWDTTKPNMVTNSFGRNAHTTRTFTWISVGLYKEYLQYRVKGTSEWITLESITDISSPYNKVTTRGYDGVWFTTHKQIVSGLTPNVYEFRVGRLNTEYWSDIYEFEIAQPTDDWGFTMTTDQQCWNWKEYEPWRISAEHIYKWENDLDPAYPATGTKNVGFHLNAGDMTENGIRPFEWMYYYNAGASLNNNYCQINAVGNNDLCPEEGKNYGKVNPDSFEWFYTFEHNPNNMPRLPDGTLMKAVYSFDYNNAHFVVLNSNNYIEEQKAWFRADMDEVNARPNPPRWKIVLVHDAMFNIVTDVNPTRDTGMNQRNDPDLTKRYSWSRLLEEYGVHLVLSGHKHTYSRSKPVLERLDNEGNVIPLNPIRQVLENPQPGDDLVDEITGVTYIMCQATGSKLNSNKDIPAQSIPFNAFWFPGADGQFYPTYIKFDVTGDDITHYSYQVRNVMPTASYSYDPYNPIMLPKERYLIDSSKITKK